MQVHTYWGTKRTTLKSGQTKDDVVKVVSLEQDTSKFPTEYGPYRLTKSVSLGEQRTTIGWSEEIEAKLLAKGFFVAD